MRGDPKKGRKARSFDIDRRKEQIEERGATVPRSSTSTGVARYTQTAFEMRRGPSPDADELVRYAQAHPEAPAIIMEEFRRQSEHMRQPRSAFRIEPPHAVLKLGQPACGYFGE